LQSCKPSATNAPRDDLRSMRATLPFLIDFLDAP
jgi:hypothetical protein